MIIQEGYGESLPMLVHSMAPLTSLITHQGRRDSACSRGILERHDVFLLLCQVSAETGEKLWRMPLAPEYGDQVKSKIADLKNVGARPGSSITAALFLKEFVEKVSLTWFRR